MSTSKMTCSQCGAALPAGAARCSYCGSAVQSARPEAPPTVEKRSMPLQFVGLKRPKVRRSLETAGFALFLALILIIAGVIAFWLGMDFYRRSVEEYNRLAKEGLPANAKVVRLDVDYGEESDSYYVYYEFVAKVQGRAVRFQGSEEISRGYYYKLSVGEEIPIIYLPSDPNVSAVKAEFGPPDPLITLLASGGGGVLILLGLVQLVISLIDMYRLDSLRSHGRLTQAFIFDRWTGTDSDGDPTYFVAYAFEAQLPNGRKVTVTRAIQSWKMYNLYQVGDAVPVRYLPDRPQICRLEIDAKSPLS